MVLSLLRNLLSPRNGGGQDGVTNMSPAGPGDRPSAEAVLTNTSPSGPGDMPSEEAMLTDMSLPGLGLNHKVAPGKQFPGWPANVMRVGSVTVESGGDFDCIHDVLGHKYHIFDGQEPSTPPRARRRMENIASPGGTSGKKDATNDQPTPPANKNTSTKRITLTNDNNDIPTKGDDYVYSTPSLKKK